MYTPDLGFRVTPWEVQGEVDYDKLVEEFGVERITPELLREFEKMAGGSHYLLRRGFFFAHRDLELVLRDCREGRGFFLYTGRAPSRAPMHLGHAIPLMLTKWLQEKFGVNAYIMIPDEEKYLAKKVDSLGEVEPYVEQDILNIIALGFDPDRTFIFRDTEYIRHLYRAAVEVARHITLSTARATFGFSGETSIGLIFYPALQIVPTLFEGRRPLIPCAIDQDPYFRLQRDVAPKLGFYKTAELLSKFVWGLEGPGSKMSASRPETAILLSDEPGVAAKKVREAFTGGRPTIKEQRELGGEPERCSVFHWFSILFEEDDERLADRYRRCKAGELLCGECKAELAQRVEAFLREHQRRVEDAERLRDRFLYDGELARRMWEWDFKPRAGS